MLRVDAADRKIGLSRKRLHEPEPDEGAEGDTMPTDGTAPEGAVGAESKPTPAGEQKKLRGGTGSGSGQLIEIPEPGSETAESTTAK